MEKKHFCYHPDIIIKKSVIEWAAQNLITKYNLFNWYELGYYNIKYVLDQVPYIGKQNAIFLIQGSISNGQIEILEWLDYQLIKDPEKFSWIPKKITCCFGVLYISMSLKSIKCLKWLKNKWYGTKSFSQSFKIFDFVLNNKEDLSIILEWCEKNFIKKAMKNSMIPILENMIKHGNRSPGVKQNVLYFLKWYKKMDLIKTCNEALLEIILDFNNKIIFNWFDMENIKIDIIKNPELLVQKLLNDRLVHSIRWLNNRGIIPKDHGYNISVAVYHNDYNLQTLVKKIKLNIITKENFDLIYKLTRNIYRTVECLELNILKINSFHLPTYLLEFLINKKYPFNLKVRLIKIVYSDLLGFIIDIMGILFRSCELKLIDYIVNKSVYDTDLLLSMINDLTDIEKKHFRDYLEN